MPCSATSSKPGAVFEGKGRRHIAKCFLATKSANGRQQIPSNFSCWASVACRSGKVLGWAEQRKSWTHDVFFGWNAAVLQQGTISVGDAVAVIAARA
jgi:hypothetical protein